MVPLLIRWRVPRGDTLAVETSFWTSGAELGTRRNPLRADCGALATKSCSGAYGCVKRRSPRRAGQTLSTRNAFEALAAGKKLQESFFVLAGPQAGSPD
jgi:hypothetical protein